MLAAGVEFWTLAAVKDELVPVAEFPCSGSPSVPISHNITRPSLLRGCCLGLWLLSFCGGDVDFVLRVLRNPCQASPRLLLQAAVFLMVISTADSVVLRCISIVPKSKTSVAATVCDSCY